MLSALIAEVEQKKAQLDRLRPLSPSALGGLEHAYDLELTYTSNAIEGNTLTQIETALVIEHGVTIGGLTIAHAHGRQAAGMSVWEKSSPLNRRGAEARLATA